MKLFGNHLCHFIFFQRFAKHHFVTVTNLYFGYKKLLLNWCEILNYNNQRNNNNKDKHKISTMNTQINIKNPPPIEDKKTMGYMIKSFNYIQRYKNPLTSPPTPITTRLQRIHNPKSSPNKEQRFPLFPQSHKLGYI